MRTETRFIKEGKRHTKKETKTKPNKTEQIQKKKQQRMKKMKAESPNQKMNVV